MAFLAAALPYIAAAGTVVSGVAAASQAQKRAGIMDFNAKQAIASGTQAEANTRIQTSLQQSRLRALAASSGGAATDPTVQGLQTNIGTEGEYRALSKLYTGKAAAAGETLQADALRSQANADLFKGVIGGASSLFSMKQSFLNKYGYGGYYGAGDDLAST